MKQTFFIATRPAGIGPEWGGRQRLEDILSSRLESNLETCALLAREASEGKGRYFNIDK